MRISKASNVTLAWIAKKLSGRLKRDLEMKLARMRKELRESYGIEVSKMQLYKVKWNSKDKNKGSHSESYAKLQEYVRVVRITNPSPLVKISVHRKTSNFNFTFKRLFISF